MGTDRFNEFSGACPCGNGTLEIMSCSDDQVWSSTPPWYETSIQCPTCSQTFSIQRRDKNFFLIQNEYLEKTKALSNEARSLRVALMKTTNVVALLGSLIVLLEKQPSMAATHRLLCAAGLEQPSIATFRKRWSNAHTWVSSHASTASLTTIMNLLGSEDAEIELALGQIAKVAQMASIPAPVIGNPFYALG